jgi:hypothetical protein
MKNSLNILLFGFVYSIICAACNDIGNNNIMVTYPKDVDISNYSLKGTSCSWNWQNIQINTVHVINSEEELITYTSCEKKDAPSFDFNKYSLLLAHGGTTSGVHKIDRNLQQTSIDEYKLTVDITLEMTTVAQGWMIAVLTPKLLSSTTIELDVKQHY